jgi:putative Mg2+ transporter-C (MgtC) family protein
MLQFFLTQGDYLLRVLVAAICGMAIGYEREARLKMAGIRTHSIIAMAASLMVVISKYGFFDVIVYDSVSIDASRVAASVVTGVGFLGAGIILNRKTNISGLTTAAGIWATLGIGMTIGAGMWTLGIGSTIMLILLQYFFHKNLRVFKINNVGHVLLHMKKNEDTRERVTQTLTSLNIQIVATHLNIYDDDIIEANLDVIFPKNFDTENVITLMANYPEIAPIDI